MPDLPESNKRPRPAGPIAAPPPGMPRYAELHCKTNFSFLEGASHADELVVRAAELGYAALAVTDRNTLAGVVRAHGTAKDLGFKLLIGAELTLVDAPNVVLWATDRKAYGRLSRLITSGHRQAPKGQFQLTFDELAALGEGLLAGVLPGELPDAAAAAALDRYRDALGDRAYLLAELHLGPDDERRLERLVRLGREARVPLLAAGDVHYHRRSRLALADVLTAIRLGTTVDQAGDQLFANGERHLKATDEIALRFARVPAAVARTVEVASRCTFSLDELRYEYPEELAPQGRAPLEYLTHMTWAGARKRYPVGIPDKVRSLVEHELTLIGELRYEAYFLTVFDMVRFARRRGILCQGRGSAANSAVCYCLGVTAVDPDQLDVLFERFLSRERNEAPDIDVDFEHERREEVLQYLYNKYGRQRAGMTAEVITYRHRSAVRDVGKALGLSLDRVDTLAKSLDGRHRGAMEDRYREAGIDPDSPLGSRLLGLVEELVGFPRHLGQHVGGMVMTQGPLCELVPIENAAMDDRTVIEWNKDDLDELGILKVDCLSLGMLTAIRRSFDMIRQHTGRELTLATVPKEDPEVYKMIQKADTMGVFQIESRAQMSMLPRLKPSQFYDLVIEVAIVRPGPIQGNMVHPYLRRRDGLESAEYPNEAIREVLSKTLGVPLFQEQAMRLAVVAAGFTPGEADQLRRAMGAWRKTGVIEKFQHKLRDGMIARGLSAEFAQLVFTQIRGFGEYGFPESHAASFALLVYISCWLKHYHPAVFCAALINSQPMGFYAPAQLVRNAREHEVEVRAVEVNSSDWECTLERTASGQLALRLGLRMISGLSETHGRTIERARRKGPFESLGDFTRRTRLSRAVLVKLAEADAFGSLGIERRKALWQALAQDKQARQLPLLDHLVDDDPLEAPLPEMPLRQQVATDYESFGLSLRAHPIQFQRPLLDELGVLAAEELSRAADGRFVRVAGLVLVRQRPGTAKGITFVTLEDETGAINLIIRQDVWERFYRPARTAAALIASGRLQRKSGVTHVLVTRLEDLSQQLGKIHFHARDFQ